MARALLLVTTLLALSAQEPSVTGARVSLKLRQEPAPQVTLVNERDSAVVEYRLRITASAAARGINEHASFERLAPRARKTLDLRVQDSSFDTIVLSLAVFEDGHVEGLPDTLNVWRGDRRALSDDLTYWIGVLSTMPRISEPDLRAHLASHLAGRADRPDPRTETVRARLVRILQRYPSGPEVWEPLDGLRADAERERAAVRRTLDGPAAQASPGTLAIVSPRASTTPNVVASIENLRDVAIEAFGFEVLKPASNQPDTGMSMRLCPSRRAEGESDHGFIRAGETRDVPIGRQPLPDAPLPPVRLRFVLYADGSFEGRAFDRDELLRQRACGQ
jgi:hypothetical protein